MFKDPDNLSVQIELNPTPIQCAIINTIFDCERAISNWLIEEIHFHYKNHFDKNLAGLNKFYEWNKLWAKNQKKEIPKPFSNDEIKKIFSKPFPKIPDSVIFSYIWNNIISNTEKYSWMQHSYIQKNYQIGKIKHYPPSATSFIIKHVLFSFEKFNKKNQKIFRNLLEKKQISYSYSVRRTFPEKFRNLLLSKNHIVKYSDCYSFLKECPKWKKFNEAQIITWQTTDTLKGAVAFKIKSIRDIIDYVFETEDSFLFPNYKKFKPLITKNIYENNEIEFVPFKNNSKINFETLKTDNLTITRNKLPGNEWHLILKSK